MITQGEVNQIKEELKYIKHTRAWAIMQGTLADEARKSLFEKAKNSDDMMAGKMLLYALDVQQKILEFFDKQR